jgi:hypothetical protein
MRCEIICSTLWDVIYCNGIKKNIVCITFDYNDEIAMLLSTALTGFDVWSVTD